MAKCHQNVIILREGHDNIFLHSCQVFSISYQ